MTTSAGLRNRPIRIEARNDEARDAHGQPIEDAWLEEPVAECWAMINPKFGREASQSEQFAHPQTTVFRILHRAGLTTDMSVVYMGERYLIDDIVEVGALNDELDIVAHRQSVETGGSPDDAPHGE